MPPAPVTVRPATPGDAVACADVHLDCWEEAYRGLVPDDVLAARRADRAGRIERWQGILGAADAHVWVAVDRDRMLGWISAAEGRDEPADHLPRHEVWGLYVRAEAYGAGVGAALLDAAVGDAAAYLWVLDGNDRAIAFYRKHRFEFDGARKVDEMGLSDLRMVRGTI